MIDADLVRQARHGDVDAFLAVVSACEARVYRIGLSFTRNPEDAADILQETVLTAYQSLTTLQDDQRVEPWMCRIATNHALMLLRARRRRPEVSMEDVEGRFDEDGHRIGVILAWPASVEDELERRRLAARIPELAECLPETYRAIWTLGDVEQLTMEEIAAILDITVPNVKSRLHRARLALRKLLADELLGDGGAP